MLRPLPSSATGLPRSLPTTLPTCRANPGGSRGCACRLLPHTCGLPQMTGGSASALELSRPARASLCYGPSDRSAAQGRLRRRAPTQPVIRPSRLPASGPIDNYPGETLPHSWFAPSGARSNASVQLSRHVGFTPELPEVSLQEQQSCLPLRCLKRVNRTKTRCPRYVRLSLNLRHDLAGAVNDAKGQKATLRVGLAMAECLS